MSDRIKSCVFVLLCASSLSRGVAQTACISAWRSEYFPLGAPPGAIGYSLELSADGLRAAIGHGGYTSQGWPSGAVWVLDGFRTSAPTQTLVLPTPVVGTRAFGSALDFNRTNDVMAVGARGGAGDLGKAFVFRHDGANWTQEWSAQGISNDGFGWAVELSADGGTLVVGAPLRDVPGLDDGAVFTYRSVAGVWTLQSTITPQTLPQSTKIGNVLAMTPDGNTLAIRSFGWFWGEYGAVFILERNGSSWTPVVRITEPVAYSSAFATVLDLSADGKLLVAGSASDSRIAYGQGSVTIFRKGASGWAYDGVLLPVAPVANGSFGYSVALNDAGDRLCVGAVGHQLNGVPVGAVEEFEFSAGGWTRVATHLAPNPEFNATFGYTVVSDSTGRGSLVGEPWSTAYGANAGRVHIYDAPCLTPTTYCTAQTNSLGCAAQIGAQGTPSTSSSSGFVIAATNTRNRQNGMLLYGTSGRAALPWLGGTLCVSPPLRRTPIVNSGGSPAPLNDCSGVLARDFNTWAFNTQDPALFPGQHVRAQFYSRDPGASHDLNLSDALEFYLEP